MQMQRFAARAQFLRSVAQLSVLNPRFLLRWLMGNSRYGTKLIKCWCRWLLKGQAYRIQEAILRNIELPNDEVPGVAAMLRYLYTGDYFDEAGRSNSPTSGMQISTSRSASPQPESEKMPADESDDGFQLLFDVKVYIMADIYDFSRLKSIAKEKFEKASTTW